MDEIAAEFGGRDAPILDYARLRATISERERAQSRASRLQRRQAANDALAALRRGDIITIGQGRRGGLAVVLEPAGDGDDPRPLVLTEDRWAGRISSTDFSGCVGAGGVDDAAEARRAPAAAGPPRRRVGAAVGRGRSATCRRAGPSVAAGPGSGPRRRSRTRRAARRRCATIPRTTSPTARSGSGSPSASCASSATTPTSRRRSTPRPTRWPAPSTGSSLLLTERGFIETDDATASHGGHRRRPSAGADLQRERPAGRRVPAQRHLGRSRRRRAGRRCVSAVLFESRGDTPGATSGVEGATPGDAARRCRRPGGRGPRSAPTSSGTGCRRVASRTPVSSPPSTGGRPRVTCRRHWRHPTPRAADPRCRQAISCDGADRCSICSTRCEMPPRHRRCGRPRNAPSTTIRRGVVAVDAG